MECFCVHPVFTNLKLSPSKVSICKHIFMFIQFLGQLCSPKQVSKWAVRGWRLASSCYIHIASETELLGEVPVPVPPRVWQPNIPHAVDCDSTRVFAATDQDQTTSAKTLPRLTLVRNISVTTSQETHYDSILKNHSSQLLNQVVAISGTIRYRNIRTFTPM